MIVPDFESFSKLSSQDELIPVWTEILADCETPVSAYWKLCKDEPVSFLLESVTGGESLARYSFLGTRPKSIERKTLSEPTELLDFVRNLPHFDASHYPHLPPFLGGAVGMISYDYVRTIESIPATQRDDLSLDSVVFMHVETLVVFDHAKNRIIICSLAEPTVSGYERAQLEIERVLNKLSQPLPPLPSEVFAPTTVESNRTQENFEATVRKIKDYIVAGDCFQCVPSVRFSCPVQAEPITVYRALRSLNPSPYMYLLNFGDFQIVGASPELLVSLKGTKASVRPIAGTRPRSEDPSTDDQLAMNLLADEKERAEHIMLVDLGRNDLGRVCEYGSVEVHDLMTVERYSHVMHIVSSVTGHLRSNVDAVDLVRACFPAGTVSGAPKVRAMEIIEECEPSRRGLYAGAVGYFSANGDLDLAIAIRTILLQNGRGYVQAGAGIVFDSDPTSEWNECQNKARACLKAIELAQSGLKAILSEFNSK